VLLCNMEPLEVFMEYYNKLVPHIYIPEPAVMEVNSANYFYRLFNDAFSVRENCCSGTFFVPVCIISFGYWATTVLNCLF
jgi:hypothetical protein